MLTGESQETSNPKVRPLDAFPTQIEGKEMIGIKDPTGICPSVVFLPPETFFLITLMNGNNGLRDLQAAYMRKYGTLLYSDNIERLIEQLNSLYLLETRYFHDHLCQLREDFKNSRTREAAFAGKGYEADTEMLKAQLMGYFTGEDGVAPSERVAERKELRGIIAPHIDFARGGTCYAHAYKTLGKSSDADLYIILGTCHTPMQYPFAFTLKSFQTPFGTVEVADEIKAIAERFPFDPFCDEFSHRNEHTIEFQVIFLKYLLGEKEFKIFPILCGSFHEMIQKGISPMQDPIYKNAISTLAHGCAMLGKTFLVASADLAHVGPQFGDSRMVTPEVLAEVKAKDLEMLGYVEALQEEEYYGFIHREGNSRNICGLPPMYALLHMINAHQGELLRYQQWSDPHGNGAVTFASMAFS